MKPRWSLLILLVAFIALALGYSIVTPLGEAPDEVSHWAYVQYLVNQHALPKPEGAVLGESHQPPLYYLLGALATFWIPQPEFAAIANPDFAFEQPQTPNLLLHTRREQFPYRDVPLAWHLWRLFSVAMGAVTVWTTYQLGLVILSKASDEFRPQNPALAVRDSSSPKALLRMTERHWAALAAAAFVAFLPGFTFLSAVVNNDNLVIMLSALGILQALRAARANARRRDLVLLGVILGLAVLTKLSGLVLWLFSGTLLLWVAWSHHNWRTLIRTGAWVFGIGIVIVAPWILYNLTQYGDPLGWSLVMAATPVRNAPITVGDLVLILRGLWTSFWGRFGGALHLRMSDAIYMVLGIIPILALVGWVRQRRDKADYATLGLVALFWFFMLAAFARWTLVMLGTDQARQLYPGLPLLALLMMLGLARLFETRARLALAVTSGALFALDVAAVAYLGMTFSPPPMLDFVPRPESTATDFGNTIRLLA